MKLRPRFRVGSLEYSQTLNEQLYWEEAKGTHWAGGWRLPTIEELRMLFEEQPDSRCLAFYWSDTYLSGVYFENGEDYKVIEDCTESVCLVREVR